MAKTGYVLINKNEILFCGRSNAEIGIFVRYKAICNNFDTDNLTWDQICFNFDRKERKVVSKLFGILPEVDPKLVQSLPEVDPKLVQSLPEVCPKIDNENNDLACAHVYDNNINNNIKKQNITNITNITDSAAAPACLSDDGKKYAFEGEVIRLKQKDFDDWQRAYPDLNIYAECVVRDSWLREQPESERKRWFMSTAAYFAKQNERRKRQNAELASEVDNREILGFAEPRKLTAEDIERFMRS